MRTPLYIQIKYAKLFGQRHLQRYTVKNNSPLLINGRCPICGDSSSNKIKARFYFYEKQGGVFCQCHNCGFSTTVEGILRTHDEYLYRELLTERFSGVIDVQTPSETLAKKTNTLSDSWKNCLIPAKQFSKAKSYLEGRGITKAGIERFYYVKNLKHSYVDICTELNIEVDSSKNIPEMEGIFIPFLDKDGKLTFSTTRNLDPTSTLRYATIEFFSSYKLFGLDKVDTTKTIYVTEGPFDSLFLPNSVATGDASLDRAAQCLPKDKLVLVPDNEPRHPVQLKRIEKFIKDGYNVVLFPNLIQTKDLTDMVMKEGLDVVEVVSLNTYSGLRAKLEFETWAKL